MRGGERLLDLAAGDDQLILGRLRLELGLPLSGAADSPIEDGDIQRGGGEIAAVLANVRGMQ